MRRFLTLISLVLVFTVVAASCGDDDSSDDSSETSTDDSSGDSTDDSDSSSEGRPHTEMSAEELEVWQTDLAAVGCYGGAIDGANGPLTESAVRAYQSAKALTVDGLLGPQTEAALQESVAAGETVCTTSAENEDAAATATLSSSGYGPITFALGSCSLNADVSNLSIVGQAEGLSIGAEATEGTGTVSVDGGTEQDGITLNGTIDNVEIDDDRTFTATGEFGEPNNVGEAFTLTGSCPE